jgi:superfamily II DNA helicase RecQ
LRSLQSVHAKSTGKLYAELYPGKEISRDNFEEVLGAMARAEILTCADAVFEKLGQQIPYRTVSLAPAGRSFDPTKPLVFVMKSAANPVSSSKRKKKSRKSRTSPKAAPRIQPVQAGTGAGASGAKSQTSVEQALRSWRLSEAKHRNIPAFRIFGDQALRSIAATCPQTDAELLALPGIGLSIVKKYGPQIFRLIAGST